MSGILPAVFRSRSGMAQCVRCVVAGFAAILLTPAAALLAADMPPAGPNIVYILCDDLGYGDVHCLNPQRGKIATPHMDRLATQGMVFTEAHSSSAVCSPTRYGILTGRYNWRSRLQSGVLHGFGKPLIAADRLTVPGLLKQHGYRTACIGKWHLGMEIPEKQANPQIQQGPITRGFDTYFGISASLDMPPYAFIAKDRFTCPLDTVKELYAHRRGPAATTFEAVDVLPTFARKAVEYLGQCAADPQPFFLYLPLNSPHTPLAPTKEWQGKSGLGTYADFVMETDWAIGEVVAALDQHGLAGNTLLILTSDNGCAPYIGVAELEAQGHFPSEQRRGYKADIFDGGHRIPFMARWPGKIQPGARCDQLICLNDLMATCAEILGVPLPPTAGEDSVSILPALLGKAEKPLHEAVVHHSVNGSFAIRQGNWKLECCPSSGGWAAPKPRSKEAQQLPPVQLYDMTKDVGERANEYQAHPEIVARLMRLLQQYIADGRSTPGPRQANDVPIKLWKERPPDAELLRQIGD